jgi:hypothetical protein
MAEIDFLKIKIFLILPGASDVVAVQRRDLDFSGTP